MPWKPGKVGIVGKPCMPGMFCMPGMLAVIFFMFSAQASGWKAAPGFFICFSQTSMNWSMN